MPSPRPRGSSVFSGLVLILIGTLLLLHNYRGFALAEIFLHWWPLLLIFWGAIKLYERTIGMRSSQPGAARISGGGSVFLSLPLVRPGVVGRGGKAPAPVSRSSRVECPACPFSALRPMSHV